MVLLLLFVSEGGLVVKYLIQRSDDQQRNMFYILTLRISTTDVFIRVMDISAKNIKKENKHRNQSKSQR